MRLTERGKQGSRTSSGAGPRALLRRALPALCAGLVALVFLHALPAYSQGGGYDERSRFGVAVAGHKGSIQNYDVGQLRAGWYLDWGVRLDPPEPAGMEYAQMLRVHQMTECWPSREADREVSCPYTTPYTYTLTNGSYQNPGQTLSHAEIVSIAQANPGSLWLIGNEMDRRDWDGGGQDEMLPEVYAQAYYELHSLVKGADATAQVAIGGVIQPTDCRLEYLNRVLAEYQSEYGSMIPVDVWNIHNMILPENTQYGAQLPPGMTTADCTPAEYSDQDADDIGIFEQHVRDFRQWMKDNGEQDKPLIISEYSVLYPASYGYDYSRVSNYLLATFDYMTTATDSALGYAADENRLVQRWVWYSLNDDGFEGQTSWHHLFDPNTREITDLGEDYADYVNALCYPSDIDCDCDVDIADVQLLAASWRCRDGQACYHPWYDLDGDQVVTVVDIMQVAVDWNWACP